MPAVCLESILCASRAELVESQATITGTATEMTTHARNSVSRLVVLRRALLRVGSTCRWRVKRTCGVPLSLFFSGGKEGNASCTVAPLRHRVWDSDEACQQAYSPVGQIRAFVSLYFLNLVALFGAMLRRLRICRTKIRTVPCRISIIGARYASCSASTDGSKIRNIALMAHIGTRASLLYFTRYFVMGHSLFRVLFVLTD